MCYWVGTKKVREEMLRRLQQQPEDEIAQLFYKTFVGQADVDFKEYYVAIAKANPELSAMVAQEKNNIRFRTMTWGLPWSYQDKKTEKSYSRIMINSTCEKIFFVHKDIIFKKRCVIPLDGYYEFFHFGSEVYPHFMFPVEGLFYAAGVWDEVADTETGEIREVFSIITTPPNAIAQKLHNNPKAPNGPRMLMILPHDKVTHYLDPSIGKDDLKALFLPYPETKMDAYPTARFLRKEFAGKINTEEVRKRIDYPELFFA